MPVSEYSEYSAHARAGKDGNAELVKLRQQVKDLKAELKEAEGNLAILRSQLASAEARTELRVEKRALEVELKAKADIQQAFKNGFDECKKSLRELKELQSCM